MNISVKWIDRFREPTQPPNPKYPNGIDVDIAKGRESCLADLPYPARRCGHYLVVCDECGYSAVITTAGRADDPRTARLPCKVSKRGDYHDGERKP